MEEFELGESPVGQALLEAWDDPAAELTLDKVGVTLEDYQRTLGQMLQRVMELAEQRDALAAEGRTLPRELDDELGWRLAGRVLIAALDGGGYAVLHPRDGYVLLPKGTDRTWVLRAVQSRWPHTCTVTKLDDLLVKYAPGALLRVEDHYSPVARGMHGHALRRSILEGVPEYEPREHPRVGEFLASLFGDSEEHQAVLAQYLWRAKRFELGVPMLVLYGRANGGKSLVTNVLTKYLSGKAGAIPEHELFHEFNGMLKQTPVVNIIERATDLRGSVFRAMTDQSEHRVNDKGEKRITVVGKLRFIASCNELSNITQSVIGGAHGDDRDAIKRRMWLVQCSSEHATRQAEFLAWCDAERDAADLAFCEHFAWMAQAYGEAVEADPALVAGWVGDGRFLKYPAALAAEQEERFNTAAVSSLTGEDALGRTAFYDAIAKLLLRASTGDLAVHAEVRKAIGARGEAVAVHLPTMRERYMNNQQLKVAEALVYPEGGGKALRLQVGNQKFTQIDRAKFYAWLDSDDNTQTDLDTEAADRAFARLQEK